MFAGDGRGLAPLELSSSDRTSLLSSSIAASRDRAMMIMYCGELFKAQRSDVRFVVVVVVVVVVWRPDCGRSFIEDKTSTSEEDFVELYVG